METKKTIEDMHNAMREMYAESRKNDKDAYQLLLIHKNGGVDALRALYEGDEWIFRVHYLGTIDLSPYAPDAWKESLIMLPMQTAEEENVNNGNYECRDCDSDEGMACKHCENRVCLPPVASSGFVPVKMEDFDARGNYTYRGSYLIVRGFKEESEGRFSTIFEVSGSDINRFDSLTDLNIFLEQQWRALGGQKGSCLDTWRVREFGIFEFMPLGKEIGDVVPFRSFRTAAPGDLVWVESVCAHLVEPNLFFMLCFLILLCAYSGAAEDQDACLDARIGFEYSCRKGDDG